MLALLKRFRKPRVTHVAVCPLCRKKTEHFCGMGACGDRCPTHGFVEAIWIPEE